MCTCFTDLDQGSKMIILESILATFLQALFFEAAVEVVKIGLSLKSKHLKENNLAQICETRFINNITHSARYLKI
jgi:hypothetical protein